MNIISAPLSGLPEGAAPQRAVLLAAEAVLALLVARAPTRIIELSLSAGIQYAVQPDLAALQANRGLLEDVMMVRLAACAAAQLLGQPPEAAPHPSAEWLRLALIHPEEQAVAHAYWQVLEARARALLKTHWAEVQVVAAGLTEVGQLSAEALRWRMDCAQSIRGRLLN